MNSSNEGSFIKTSNLIKQFEQGDAIAVKFMYDNFLPEVIGFIKNKGGTDQDAKDVFQEAIMALYKQVKTGKLKLRVHLKTYFIAICKNQWLKSIRNNHRMDSMIPDFDPSDLDQNLIKELERAEKFRLIQAHLKEMSPSNRAILSMHLQKYSTKEIAKALNFSLAYVKKRKFLSKKALLTAVRNDTRFRELKN